MSAEGNGKMNSDSDSNSDSNPYAAPESLEAPEQNSAGPGGPTKIRWVSLLFFVCNGVLIGSFAIPRSAFPASLHPLRDYRNTGIGALAGLLVYVLMEYFRSRDEEPRL